MKADLSRDTFKKANHYSSVRLQQGRVVTDADWNEQADLSRHRLERTARDVIGKCGAPIETAGFELKAATFALAVFASATEVWVAGEDGIVLRTQDAGATWQLQATGTTRHLRAIGFSGTTGWAVGDGGTILKTTNSGDDWVAQNAGTTASLRAIAVVDANRVWVVGDSGTIIHTADGGATTDGGTSWRNQGPGTTRLDGVCFVNASRGFAVGQGGTILTTSDGGENWTALKSVTHVHLRAVWFVNEETGWVAGDGGTLLKTENGGANWTPQATGATTALLALAFRSETHGWAVGDGGKVFSTTNGGTWISEDLGTEASLRAIALPAASAAGWIVGDDSIVATIEGGSPDTVVAALPPMSLSIGAGRLYVDGSMCEVDRRTSFYNQPDRGRVERLAAGTHLLYIDVWQRHLSFIEEPSIREVALGGPDTATRARTVWQVKALALPSASPAEWSCLSQMPEWDDLVAPPSARLKARSEPQQAASNICDIAAAAGYRRLENQLYRVEVQEGGGAPRFKWSRENGSVAYGIARLTREATRSVVLLSSRGRDESLDVAIGDRLEVLDDDAALEDRVGTLLEYGQDGDEKNEIVLDGTLPADLADDPSRHPLVRRWDHAAGAGGDGALPIEEGEWIELEEGVQVWFEPGGSYRRGDYWLIPARTVTGDVEWPRDDDGDPELRPPAGIEDRYCRLALIEVGADGGVTIVSDCRRLFPPLTDLTQLLYGSGDGQDGIPGLELPQALRARVVMGGLPVNGARVRFAVEAGGGNLGGPVSLEVQTVDGLAECRWVLGPDPNPGQSHQRVRAALLDHAGADVSGQSLVFCATASVLLQSVGGDGQAGAAGQELEYPLEVRTSNGQRPVGGARVRFEIEDGTGQLSGGNPPASGASLDVATDGDGKASVRWRLGAEQAQRVTATLLDASNAGIQSVAFNAALLAQAGESTGGCAITLGPDGRFKELTTAVVEEALARFGRSLCFCLQAGDHRVGDLLIRGDNEPRDVRIAIHGCGSASTIRLDGRVVVANLAAFELANLRVVGFEGPTRGSFTFESCDDVSVTSVEAQWIPHEAPFLRFAEISRAVTLRRTTLRTESERALAAIFDLPPGEAQPLVRVADNRIEGAVSFYGPPTERELSIETLQTLPDKMKNMRFLQPSGRLVFTGNLVDRITVSDGALRPILAANQVNLRRTFASATIDGNTILQRGSLFVSQTLTLGSCSFADVGQPQEPSYAAAFFAGDAAAVGNVVSGRPSLCIIVAWNRKEAGNLATVFPP